MSSERVVLDYVEVEFNKSYVEIWIGRRSYEWISSEQSRIHLV